MFPFILLTASVDWDPLGLSQYAQMNSSHHHLR